PAGGAAGAEADDERRARIAMQQRAEKSAHHLRAGVEARMAVDLAAYDERVPHVGGQGHAALVAVRFPLQDAPLVVEPVDQLVPGNADLVRASGADRAVAPRRGRSVGGEAEE